MKKIIIGLLVILEMFLIVLLISPIFISSKSYDQAFYQWYKNPTDENKAVFEKEKTKIESSKMIAKGIITLMLVLNTGAIIILLKKK